MEILVQKFGGTSVESYEKMHEVCKIVKEYKENNKDLVVVVSAMGRKGAPYATDTLIDLLNSASSEPSKRELDIIMSCGEIISGSVLASMLKNYGIEATFLTGIQAGILTSDNHGNAQVISINTNRIKEELKRNRVVVIAGFQGGNKKGDVTTLGRGGSDTSAVAIGKALGCKFVEIYTDVDGIMTADPRVEPNAKVLNYIDYEEVFQMADKGAKVIHPRAVQLARSSNITLAIKNTSKPSNKGTKIGTKSSISSQSDSFEKDIIMMTAVAHKDKVAQIKIKTSETDFTDILTKIEEAKISIDMINFFVSEKVFVIDEDDIKTLEKIFKENKVEYEVNKNCAKVTIIGSNITGKPGIMAKIVRSLSQVGVSLLQTSDSNMTISCLVASKDMIKTINSIHKEFYSKKL